MFERGNKKEDFVSSLAKGAVIEDYAKGQISPFRLMLYEVTSKSLEVDVVENRETFEKNRMF